jgi:hypothetical protein
MAQARESAGRSKRSWNPKLSLVILDGDHSTSATLKIRVRVINFSGSSDPLPITVGADGSESVKLQNVRPSRDGPDLLIDASFDLDQCVRMPNTSLRVWAQFADSKLSTATDKKAFLYGGPPGSCPDRPRVWGVVIGISNYEVGNKPLLYAHEDAERFFRFWTEQKFYSVGRLTLLSAPPGAPVTKKVIDTVKPEKDPDGAQSADNDTVRKLLDSELAKIRDEGVKTTDIVVIYFAGHGVSERNEDVEHWYFMPSNGDISDLHSTAINAEYIKDALQHYNKSVPILVFLDACRNFAVSYGNSKFNPDAVLDFRALTDPLNADVFIATGEGQAAYELPEKDLEDPHNPEQCTPSSSTRQDEGGGAFTHVLLEILEGKMGDMPAESRMPISKVEADLMENVQKICSKQLVRLMPTSHAAPFQGFFWRN